MVEIPDVEDNTPQKVSKTIYARRCRHRNEDRGMAAPKRKKMARGATTAETLKKFSTRTVKIEDVTDEVEVALSAKLPPEGQSERDVPLSAIQQFCVIGQCGFQEVLENLVVSEGLDCNEDVSLLLRANRIIRGQQRSSQTPHTTA